MARGDLTDEEWAVLEGLLPSERGPVAVDLGETVEGDVGAKHLEHQPLSLADICR